jgi:hypothetical protein
MVVGGGWWVGRKATTFGTWGIRALFRGAKGDDRIDPADCASSNGCGLHGIQDGFSNRGLLDDVFNKAVKEGLLKPDEPSHSCNVPNKTFSSQS